jgi:peptidoglycan/LPS O-acetylase OafA/YrhL
MLHHVVMRYTPLGLYEAQPMLAHGLTLTVSLAMSWMAYRWWELPAKNMLRPSIAPVLDVTEQSSQGEARVLHFPVVEQRPGAADEDDESQAA